MRVCAERASAEAAEQKSRSLFGGVWNPPPSPAGVREAVCVWVGQTVTFRCSKAGCIRWPGACSRSGVGVAGGEPRAWLGFITEPRGHPRQVEEVRSRVLLSPAVGGAAQRGRLLGDVPVGVEGG